MRNSVPAAGLNMVAADRLARALGITDRASARALRA